MDRVSIAKEAHDLREQAIPSARKGGGTPLPGRNGFDQGIGSVDRRDIGHRQSLELG